MNKQARIEQIESNLRNSEQKRARKMAEYTYKENFPRQKRGITVLTPAEARPVLLCDKKKYMGFVVVDDDKLFDQESEARVDIVNINDNFEIELENGEKWNDRIVRVWVYAIHSDETAWLDFMEAEH